jgi:hypothetical protein
MTHRGKPFLAQLAQVAGATAFIRAIDSVRPPRVRHGRAAAETGNVKVA